jgi:hypothetical protein
MDSSSTGRTLSVPLALFAAVGGYVLFGLIGFFYEASKPADGSYADKFELMGQAFKDAAWLGALAVFVAVLVVQVVRCGEVAKHLLELATIAASCTFGYLGMTRRLPFSVEGMSGALDVSDAPIVVAAIATTVIAAVCISPIPVFKGLLFVVQPVSQSVVVFAVFGPIGLIVALAIGGVLALAAGQIAAHLADDLSFSLEWFVRFGFWTAAALLVGGAGFLLQRIFGAPEPWRGRKLVFGIVAGIIVVGATLGSATGLVYAASDGIRAVQGTVNIHSTNPKCHASGVFYVRAGVRTASDIAFVQCQGCDCSGPLNVRALPDEDVTVFVRSGDLIPLQDLSISRTVPAEGKVTIPLEASDIRGTLTLERGPLWEHASGMPVAGVGPVAGSVRVSLDVGRAYGPALPPKVRVRVTTPHQSKANVCSPSYGSPECEVSADDDALRPGDVIRVTAEEASCLLACTYVEREYVVSGVDRARAVFMKRAIKTEVTIDIGGSSIPAQATFPPPPAAEPGVPAKPPDAPAKPPVVLAAPGFPGRAGAGSLLKPSSVAASSSMIQAGDRHPPEHAFDGNPKTAWNENAPGPGRGEWIEARFASPQKIRRIHLFTGYADVSKYGDLFTLNAHLKRLTVSFDGRVVRTLDVTASQRELAIEDLDEKATTVRFTAVDVWEGTQWQDLCVSEIEIFGAPKGGGKVAAAAAATNGAGDTDAPPGQP